MSNITLDGIAAVIREELKPIKKTLAEQGVILAEHSKILNTHTTALDMLLTKKKTKDEENIVSAERFKRFENWAQQVGLKLGIKLEL